MSKKKLTQKEQAAEHEYYEKVSRIERWQLINRLFLRMSAEISAMLKSCTDSAKANEADDGYSVRNREERELLNTILEGVTELKDSAVHEGVKRYTVEALIKPGWLP